MLSDRVIADRAVPLRSGEERCSPITRLQSDPRGLGDSGSPFGLDLGERRGRAHSCASIQRTPLTHAEIATDSVAQRPAPAAPDTDRDPAASR
jgi:hypothetical protein